MLKKLSLLCALLLPTFAHAADTQPAATAPAFKFEYSIDVSEVPEMQDWADKLKPVVEEWYPKIVAMLPSEKFTAPKKFSITIKKNMEGVAYTAGNQIVGASAWFKARGDYGAIIHEMVHVVQSYKSSKNPGWLVEGVADYIRWFLYEPENKRPRKPNPDKAKYTDSYQTTAGFLTYLVEKHDKDLVWKLNADMRNGKYSAENWKTYCGGKSVDDLWTEYVATFKK